MSLIFETKSCSFSPRAPFSLHKKSIEALIFSPCFPTEKAQSQPTYSSLPCSKKGKAQSNPKTTKKTSKQGKEDEKNPSSNNNGTSPTLPPVYYEICGKNELHHTCLFVVASSLHSNRSRSSQIKCMRRGSTQAEDCHPHVCLSRRGAQQQTRYL